MNQEIPRGKKPSKNSAKDDVVRGHIENELRHSEQRFRSFMNNLPGIGFIKDQSGRHVYCSQPYEETFGLEAGSWLGKTDEEILPRAAAEICASSDQRVIEQGEVLQTLETIPHQDGDHSWLMTKFPLSVPDEEGVFVAGIGLDVTKSIEVERELRRVEQFNSLIVDNVRDGAIIMLNPEGRINSWNRGAERMFGFSQSEALGQHVSLLFTEVDRFNGVADLAIAQADQNKSETRWQIRKDGSRIWCVGSINSVHGENGELIGYVKVVSDNTRAKMLEESLRESELRFRQLTENISEVFWIFDPKINQAIYVSPAFEKVFGFEPVLATPTDPLRAILPADHGKVLAHLRRVRTSGTSFEEYRIQKPGGGIRWINDRAFPLYDGQGELYRVVGIAEDITERKLGEMELKKARNAAEESNRAKSTFLANMSHEIRTPLSVILGFTDLLLKPDLPYEKKIRFGESIRRNGRLLAKLVDDVLDLSKIEAGRIDVEQASISISELVNELVAMFTPSAREKNIELSASIEKGAPETIVSDPTRLRQILVNMIGNGIKFTDRGYVRISVAASDKSSSESRLCFLIKDSGRGIAGEFKSKLFEPFVQADPSTTRQYGGTGLGLALSRRLARALGGDVELKESRVGEGSVFSVTVGHPKPSPIDDDQPGVDFDQMRNRSAGRLAGLHILLIEDSADNQELISFMLEGEGARVHVADNGRQGLERALVGPFDLVLMDLQMPEMDGYQTARTLRQNGYHKPIIALTAHAMKNEREKTFHAGCNDYLAKPFGLETLIDTIIRNAPSACDTSSA